MKPLSTLELVQFIRLHSHLDSEWRDVARRIEEGKLVAVRKPERLEFASDISPSGAQEMFNRWYLEVFGE